MGSGKNFVSLAQFGLCLRNRKRVPCFYRVMEKLVEVWENSKTLWKHSPVGSCSHKTRVSIKQLDYELEISIARAPSSAITHGLLM